MTPSQFQRLAGPNVSKTFTLWTKGVGEMTPFSIWKNAPDPDGSILRTYQQDNKGL